MGAVPRRMRELADLEQQGELGSWARDVLLGADGLLNQPVYERLLPDLHAPKVLRLERVRAIHHQRDLARKHAASR